MKLLGAQQPLSAGRKHELLCQSSGSRPPAVITWWRDGQRLDTTTETVRSSLLYRISSTLLPFLAPIPTVGVCNNVAQPTMKWPVQFVAVSSDHETTMMIMTTTNGHSDCSRVIHILLYSCCKFVRSVHVVQCADAIEWPAGWVNERSSDQLTLKRNYEMAQTNEHEESHKTTTTINKYETHVARLHSISPQLRATTVSFFPFFLPRPSWSKMP